ncbi:unnamed protein product, partial [Brassica rapa subsp. trilocularis]
MNYKLKLRPLGCERSQCGFLDLAEAAKAQTAGKEENKWYFRSCRDPSIRLIVSQIKAFPIVMSNDPIIVWFPQNVPRFAFITWLAIKDRLATSHRMQRWGQRHDFFVSSVESQMKQEITSSPV